MKPIVVDTSVWVDWARGKHNRIVDPGLKDFVKAGEVLSQLKWPASKRL